MKENVFFLYHPEYRPGSSERKVLLDHLKHPAQRNDTTLAFLRDHALRTTDQIIQCAAIHGLEKWGGAQALLAISTRILDVWGMRAIERAIKALGNLAADGGGLCLAALLYQDYRFTREKTIAIEKCAVTLQVPEVASLCHSFVDNYRYSCGFSTSLPAILARLEAASWEDVHYGAVLARQYHFGWAPEVNLPMPNQLTYLYAARYAEDRVPGLVSLLASTDRMDSEMLGALRPHDRFSAFS